GGGEVAVVESGGRLEVGAVAGRRRPGPATAGDGGRVGGEQVGDRRDRHVGDQRRGAGVTPQLGVRVVGGEQERRHGRALEACGGRGVGGRGWRAGGEP